MNHLLHPADLLARLQAASGTNASRRMRGVVRRTAPGAALGAALGLAACAGQPPQPGVGGMLGYGTPGVASYMPAGQATDLQALVERCRQVPARAGTPQPQSLEAACDELRRTMFNQPGNTVRPVNPS